MLRNHGQISGEHGDKQDNKAPGGVAARGGNENTGTAENFCCSAEEDELAVGRQVGRHNGHVRAGKKEMERASTEVQDAHRKTADCETFGWA